ncbi:MAG: hypothetical protein ACLVK8_10230 [Ruminococcus sp.]
MKIKSGEETELNGQGPVIDDAAVKALFLVTGRFAGRDTIILAGSIPNTMPSDIAKDSAYSTADRSDGRTLPMIC